MLDNLPCFKRRGHVAIGISVAALLVAFPVSAQTMPRVQAGVLSCQVAGGAGFVIGSTRQLECTWAMPGGRRERYFGVINRFGIDVGATAEGTITWGVLTTTTTVGPGALVGTFAGVGAEATIWRGLGANVLVGGSSSGVALQPVSVQTQQGVNIAAGIAALQLRLDE